MKNFDLVFPILMPVIGVVLMIWTTRFNRKLLNGQETSLKKYFIGATLFGLWVFLISVGVILGIGTVSGDGGWTTYETIEIVILGIIGGIVAIMGSLWQFFIVTKFREILYRALSRKNK
jgi:steroid 5-alpha reductase family enzyme